MKRLCGIIKGQLPSDKKKYDGITVCSEWVNSIDAYEDWAFKNGWRKGLVIVRKDKTKDFSPDNCIVTTRTEAHYLRRNTIKVNGEPLHKLYIESKRDSGICYATVKSRFTQSNFTANDAIHCPVISHSECGKIPFNGHKDSGKPDNYTRKYTIRRHESRPIYRSWQYMRSCCGLTKRKYGSYVAYKKDAVNIEMFTPWADDYRTFEKWALEQGWKPGDIICRKDKRKGFNPNNCIIGPYETAWDFPRNI